MAQNAHINIPLLQKTISLLPINPAHPIQLLLSETEDLQVSASIDYLHNYIADLKSSGKKTENYTCILEHIEKVGLDLWELPPEKYQFAGFYNSHKKCLIQEGKVHIWNTATECFETEMNYLRQRSFNGTIVSQMDIYSCRGIEFYSFTSRFF